MDKYLTVDRLEFAVTYLCNSKCRHCQLGEEEERRKFPSHIEQDLAVEIVRKVGGKYHPESIMTFGGEPLLYPEIVYAIHREAMKAEIPVREVITNGYWSRKIEKIKETANGLAKSGVNRVSISVDCFHQEFVPLETVKQAAKSLLDAGIKDISWNPCWVISGDQDNLFNRRTRAILKQLKDLSIRCSEGNVAQPEGRAIASLGDLLPKRTRMPRGKCGELPYTEKLDSLRGIYVEPDGRVSVCREFYVGNASETDIISITERYDPFNIPEAEAIISGGAEGLLKWAKTKGVESDPEGYYNVCHMCADIRKRATKK